MPQARRKCVQARVHVSDLRGKEREPDIGKGRVKGDDLGRVVRRNDFSCVRGVL